MALSRVKTWNAAETLTASDLNAEFNNICNHFGSLDNDDINSTATFTMGELIVGSGITSADGGQLHVHTASAGTIQAVADADEAVFENSAAAGITILSGTSSTGMIAFGDSGDADIGKISYSHSTNGYTITANAATALQISSAGAVTTGGNVLSDTDSTDDLGSTSVRWANVYTDAIGDSGQALGVKATTLSFDAASTIDTSGNNALTLDAGSAVLTLDGGTLESDASTLSFDAAATIDTSGNNALTLDAGSAVLTLDGGTLESDATTFSFDAAATIDTSGNNALTLDAGSAVLTLDGGTLESDALTLSFDAAATIDTSGNNNLTLSAGTGTIVATAGDVTIFDDNNNADTSLSIGTSATEALVVQALNGGSNKTLEELRFTTKTASATGDHGKMSFYIDEAEIATIDDGGIDLASGKSFTVAGSAVGGAALTGSTDNTVVTVSGANAIQGEANLTFDGTILKLDTSTSSEVRIANGSADDNVLGLSLWAGTTPAERLSIGVNWGAGYVGYDSWNAHYFQVGGSTKLTVEPDGDVKVSDGDLIIGTSGHGIDFAATSDAGGASSEVLDDYEEGTFTPVLGAHSSNGTHSYTTQVGNYTKVGNVVHIWMQMTINTLNTSGTISGNLEISGLPYTSANTTGQAYMGTFLSVGLDMDSGTGPVAHVSPNATKISLIASVDNASYDTFTSADVASGDGFWIQVSYPV